MNRATESSGFSVCISAHLTLDRAYRLIHESLPEQERQRAEEHLLLCEECCKLMLRAIRHSELESPEGETVPLDPNGTYFKRLSSHGSAAV